MQPKDHLNRQLGCHAIEEGEHEASRKVRSSQKKSLCQTTSLWSDFPDSKKRQPGPGSTTMSMEANWTTTLRENWRLRTAWAGGRDLRRPTTSLHNDDLLGVHPGEERMCVKTRLENPGGGARNCSRTECVSACPPWGASPTQPEGLPGSNGSRGGCEGPGGEGTKRGHSKSGEGF